MGEETRTARDAYCYLARRTDATQLIEAMQSDFYISEVAVEEAFSITEQILSMSFTLLLL